MGSRKLALTPFDGTLPWRLTSAHVLIAAVSIFIPAAFGYIALRLGQDANWDLLNYHYYTAYAFLHHRMGFDIEPAQAQTFLNPLLHVPYYVAASRLRPVIVGFFLGTIQGLNFVPMFWIANALLPLKEPVIRTVSAASLSLAGMLLPGNLSELGTTFGDNVLSLFIFTAVLLILLSLNGNDGVRKLAVQELVLRSLGGFIAGAAVGLKLSTAPFAFGLLAAFAILPLNLASRIRSMLASSAGLLVGFLLTDGFWLWRMWSLWHNPIFPFYNTIFRSPYAPISANTDVRWGPKGLVDTLLFPVLFSESYKRFNELQVFDLLLPVLYFLLVVLVAFSIMRMTTGKKSRLRPFRDDRGNQLKYFLFFVGFSYIAWLGTFGYYRYFVPIEMLAPITIAVTLFALVGDRRVATLFLATSILVSLGTMAVPNWGRAPWGQRTFSLELPAAPGLAKSLVLMSGQDAISYVIPFFPQTVSFVRVSSNLPMTRSLRGLITTHIREQAGPLYVLFEKHSIESTDPVLRNFGVSYEAQGCFTLHPRVGDSEAAPLFFCSVRR